MTTVDRVGWAMEAENQAIKRVRATKENYDAALIDLARAEALVDAELAKIAPGPPSRRPALRP